MAKKQKQPTYTIDFVGTDLKLEGVTVKEIERGPDSNNWALLEQKGPKWILLTTPGYLIEPLVDVPQSLVFERPEGDAPHLTNYFDERLPIVQFTTIKIDKKIYAIDIVHGGHRIQMFTGFMEPTEHNKIERITFTKEQ